MRTPEEELEELRAQDLRRRLRRFDPGEGPMEVTEGPDGPRLVTFATNDYLGLAGAVALRESFAEAVRRHGAGSGASRLVAGTRAPHLALEEELAGFKGTEACLTFSSGYAAALSVIPAVVGKGDVVILDKLCHACLVDGARLSGAVMRVFPHQDLDKLKDHLRWARSEVDARGRVLVLAESVYSMDGDETDVAALAAAKDEAGALLLLDEAHAVGLRGPGGRGVASEQGVAGRIDFQMGTLSKAFGLAGGYVASTRAWVELWVNRARGFIYSTAPPPALAEAAREALRIVQGREGDVRRETLFRNVETFDRALGGVETRRTPIRPVLAGESARALEWAESLAERGFQVPAIRFPTVPRGTARLRVSLGAGHRTDQVEALAVELARLRADGQGGVDGDEIRG